MRWAWFMEAAEAAPDIYRQSIPSALPSQCSPCRSVPACHKTRLPPTTVNTLPVLPPLARLPLNDLPRAPLSSAALEPTSRPSHHRSRTLSLPPPSESANDPSRGARTHTASAAGEPSRAHDTTAFHAASKVRVHLTLTLHTYLHFTPGATAESPRRTLRVTQFSRKVTSNRSKKVRRQLETSLPDSPEGYASCVAQSYSAH